MATSRNKGNQNAAGKRVSRERIKVDVSLSKRNGLLDLASDYLVRQGTDPSDENIRAYAAKWFYANFGKTLQRVYRSRDVE